MCRYRPIDGQGVTLVEDLSGTFVCLRISTSTSGLDIRPQASMQAYLGRAYRTRVSAAFQSYLRWSGLRMPFGIFCGIAATPSRLSNSNALAKQYFSRMIEIMNSAAQYPHAELAGFAQRWDSRNANGPFSAVEVISYLITHAVENSRLQGLEI